MTVACQHHRICRWSGRTRSVTPNREETILKSMESEVK